MHARGRVSQSQDVETHGREGTTETAAKMTPTHPKKPDNERVCVGVCVHLLIFGLNPDDQGHGATRLKPV